MNQDQHADEPKRDSVDEFANAFTEGLRRGQQPSSAEYAEQFPEISGEMTGLAKALSVLEEASFRRQGQHPQGAAIDTAGNRVQTLGGFRLIREISRGGMGIVYEAKQESLQRRVAIKVLPPSPLLTDIERARFAKEGRAVGRLHHAHIVQVFGTGHEGGVQYTVMQYIEGYSLDRLIRALRIQQGLDGASSGAAVSPDSERSEVTGFPVDAAVDRLLDNAEPDRDIGPQTAPNVSGLPKTYYQNVARIGADVADAICHSHHQGVLHRDIKPANILLDRHGDVWVADFGLAQIDDDHELTGSANLVGTLRFASPEQFKGDADERSDIYSIGMTLYELCTLEPTFSAVRPTGSDAKSHDRKTGAATTAESGDPAGSGNRHPEVDCCGTRKSIPISPGTVGRPAEFLRRSPGDRTSIEALGTHLALVPPESIGRRVDWI